VRTHNSLELLNKIKQRVPDVDDRLKALREQTRAEIDAFREIEAAFATRYRSGDHLTDVPDVASVVSLIGQVLETINADFTIRVRFADGRGIDVLPEDLAAIAAFSFQLQDAIENTATDATNQTSENGLAVSSR
jgi:hypothetical protein